VTYSYGEPAITDIYAAGAPKDAPVVDKRTAANTTTVVKRVREATQSDAADYIAILTRSKMKDGTLRADGGMRLELLVKRGQSAARHVYSVGMRSEHTPAWMHVLPIPEGWPEPDVKDVLELWDNTTRRRARCRWHNHNQLRARHRTRNILHAIAAGNRIGPCVEYMLPARVYGQV